MVLSLRLGTLIPPEQENAYMARTFNLQVSLYYPKTSFKNISSNLKRLPKLDSPEPIPWQQLIKVFFINQNYRHPKGFVPAKGMVT